jgi:hypothetical protein
VDPIACAKHHIRSIVQRSTTPEDPIHAENTLKWLLTLCPEADEALQVAALGHDIDRALEARKVRKRGFLSFDEFKAAHACNSAVILEEILDHCGMEKRVGEEICRLVRAHETGGDERSDLLKDADSLSYFDVNLPFFVERHSWEETARRCMWGYKRLSAASRALVKGFCFQDARLSDLIRQIAESADQGGEPTSKM